MENPFFWIEGSLDYARDDMVGGDILKPDASELKENMEDVQIRLGRVELNLAVGIA